MSEPNDADVELARTVLSADPRAWSSVTRKLAETVVRLSALSGEAPRGPWKMGKYENVTGFFVCPDRTTYPAWQGHWFETEPEAIAVRDALNRVAAGVDGLQGGPTEEPDDGGYWCPKCQHTSVYPAHCAYPGCGWRGWLAGPATAAPPESHHLQDGDQ